jgi:hypothetical protein
MCARPGGGDDTQRRPPTSASAAPGTLVDQVPARFRVDARRTATGVSRNAHLKIRRYIHQLRWRTSPVVTGSTGTRPYSRLGALQESGVLAATRSPTAIGRADGRTQLYVCAEAAATVAVAALVARALGGGGSVASPLRHAARGDRLRRRPSGGRGTGRAQRWTAAGAIFRDLPAGPADEVRVRGRPHAGVAGRRRASPDCRSRPRGVAVPVPAAPRRWCGRASPRACRGRRRSRARCSTGQRAPGRAAFTALFLPSRSGLGVGAAFITRRTRRARPPVKPPSPRRRSGPRPP